MNVYYCDTVKELYDEENVGDGESIGVPTYTRYAMFVTASTRSEAKTTFLAEVNPSKWTRYIEWLDIRSVKLIAKNVDIHESQEVYWDEDNQQVIIPGTPEEDAWIEREIAKHEAVLR